MGMGGSEETNLLLMETFLIDFSSICNTSTFSRDIPIWASYRKILHMREPPYLVGSGASPKLAE
jgi:hypothetical protein